MSTRAWFVALALFVLSVPLRAEVAADQGYRLLDPPQHADTPGKIEVIEFFSYGCPHCNEFYPLVTAWAAKLPKDVVFKRVATGMGRTAWTNLAKTYYTLETTGDLARLDGPLFHAIHEEHLPLFDEKSITEWVGKHGVDTAKFTTAFESFGVNTRVSQAERLLENYKVEGVPTLAVGGKYVVLGNSFEQILSNADAAVAKARSERAVSAPTASGK
ncbi:MAG: oxidoreductase [Gammaproteobacteria bacterium]|nr:oxidoreductase [Gammaproteobacteria bacterium]